MALEITGMAILYTDYNIQITLDTNDRFLPLATKNHPAMNSKSGMMQTVETPDCLFTHKFLNYLEKNWKGCHISQALKNLSAIHYKLQSHYKDWHTIPQQKSKGNISVCLCMENQKNYCLNQLGFKVICGVLNWFTFHYIPSCIL